MLLTLSIKNYALIHNLEISFAGGLSVITGETGAGKSILLGALSLLLGKRADSTVLAERDRKCVVEGLFDIGSLGLKPLFGTHDLDYDSKVYLRREIIPSGRSRAFINDTPVNLILLKTIGDLLVDVHSQHETLMLGEAHFQLQALDDFVDDPDLTGKYRDAFFSFRELSAKRSKIKEEIEKARKDEDYHRYLFQELEEAELDEDAFNNWLEQERFLSHAEEVLSGLGQAHHLLNAEDQSIGDKLGEVAGQLAKIGKYLPAVTSLVERLRSASIEVGDIAADLARLQSRAEYDPEELTVIRQKLDRIYSLQQKHRVDSVQDLIALREKVKDSLDRLTVSGEEVEALEKRLEQSRIELNVLAGSLTLAREKAAPAFASEITSLLRQLGMQEASFEVRITGLKDYFQTGKDRVDFLFSANRGKAPAEVSSIASGGELSRLMLAIKSLISREQLLPTVIFDEIDAGVSGDIAGKVGNILKIMSKHHQLIVITHLPQIAAKADHHLKVYKMTDETQTYTQMKSLDEDGRVDEIAKLLSDEKVSSAARETARELLKS